MNVQPYIPGLPLIDRCPDCGLLLYHDGTCPNPTCQSNTPTAVVEWSAMLPPDPDCPLCHGSGVMPPLPFCWNCG
jgi:hypothetical protein